MNEGKGPWHGRSERKGDDKPASLEEAIEAAWENAKGNGGSDGSFLVTRIAIEASNPITAYSVTINPGS